MKILIIHNKYKIPGGEDKVFDQECQLLRDNGHEVIQYVRDNNKDLKRIWRKFLLIFNTHYNRKEKRTLDKMLLEVDPDIVHVHNFFPLLTPSIFDSCQELKIPVVLTLHNYRIIYPNGLMMYNGAVDLRTLRGSAFKVVKDKVYRDSMVQTFVVSFMIEYHKWKKTWEKKINGYIALTEFSKEIFVSWGLPERKVFVKPNFINTPGEISPSSEENVILFVGRLSEEKGILSIAKLWSEVTEAFELWIVGDGPQRDEILKLSELNSKVKHFGPLPNSEVQQVLKKVKAMIFPSIWYEGFPMTILEAFSLGKPVISSNIGNQSRIVNHLVNGLHFDLNNLHTLKDVLALLNDNGIYGNLCKQAFKDFTENYNPRSNYRILQSIYKELLKNES